MRFCEWSVTHVKNQHTQSTQKMLVMISRHLTKSSPSSFKRSVNKSARNITKNTCAITFCICKIICIFGSRKKKKKRIYIHKQVHVTYRVWKMMLFSWQLTRKSNRDTTMSRTPKKNKRFVNMSCMCLTQQKENEIRNNSKHRCEQNKHTKWTKAKSVTPNLTVKIE